MIGSSLKPVDIRRAAMDLLARREHGFDELQQKLVKRFTRKSLVHSRCSTKFGAEPALEFALKSSPEIAFEQESPYELGPSLDEQIFEAVERLREQGLQSDARMAEAYVRYRSQRGNGPIKIAAELRQKGLSDSLVSQTLAASGIDWFALVMQVADRRFGLQVDLDLSMKAKRSRFLQQRGFSFDHIGSLGRD